MEEIKVRWKKAALENCTGVPCVTAPSFTCGTSTVSDMDGNSYNTVLIGLQCWTKENLRVRKYNDGTKIRFDTSGGTLGNVTGQTWSGIGLDYGAYSIYAHDSMATPSNLSNYGYLYNWYASKGIVSTGSVAYKNICPTGYHVPTDSDWNKLVIFIHSGADTSSTSATQSSSAGFNLKKDDALWNVAPSPSPGTNTSGFSALPGGYRDNVGSFSEVGNGAFFWSATQVGSSSNAWLRYLYYANGFVDRDTGTPKSLGASVRCLRD